MTTFLRVLDAAVDEKPGVLLRAVTGLHDCTQEAFAGRVVFEREPESFCTVPGSHHKPWQKELKATWDALCQEKYDWAHLAMHLWPERVVPKCATDRSLAIAHGLEEVFWIEGADGKWTQRKTPTIPVEELVRERTSPAVKAALESLLGAPVAAGKPKKSRKVNANA